MRLKGAGVWLTVSTTVGQGFMRCRVPTLGAGGAVPNWSMASITDGMGVVDDVEGGCSSVLPVVVVGSP